MRHQPHSPVQPNRKANRETEYVGQLCRLTGFSPDIHGEHSMEVASFRSGAVKMNAHEIRTVTDALRSISTDAEGFTEWWSRFASGQTCRIILNSDMGDEDMAESIARLAYDRYDETTQERNEE